MDIPTDRRAERGDTVARLIDADALKHKIDQEEGRRIEPGWYDGIDTCREIIENAPTIDAIPVEWIMSWSNKRYQKTQMDVSIVDVLEAWQKEQEAQDG